MAVMSLVCKRHVFYGILEVFEMNTAAPVTILWVLRKPWIRSTSLIGSRTWSGRIREEESQLPRQISNRGHTGLSVILAKDSAIKQ